MAKKLYVEVGGKTRKAKKGYVSVNGKARKIKKAYVGVNGKARAFWSGGELRYYGRATALSEARSELTATAIGGYALFAGGNNGNYSNVVDAYNRSLTRTKPAGLENYGVHIATSVGQYAIIATNDLSSSFIDDVADSYVIYNNSLTKISNNIGTTVKARTGKGVANVGNYALFAGGNLIPRFDAKKPVSTINTINSSLTLGSITLSKAKRAVCGGKVGNYALFAGGLDGISLGANYYTDVDAYNASLTRISVTAIDYGIDSVRCSASIGSSYVLFRVGVASLPSFNINAYDASLTKRSVTVPNRDSYEMAAASSENYAIFADKYYVVAYNDSLTCFMMAPLSDERSNGAAATVGNYVLFAGGLNSGKKDIVDVYTID